MSSAKADLYDPAISITGGIFLLRTLPKNALFLVGDDFSKGRKKLINSAHISKLIGLVELRHAQVDIGINNSVNVFAYCLANALFWLVFIWSPKEIAFIGNTKCSR